MGEISEWVGWWGQFREVAGGRQGRWSPLRMPRGERLAAILPSGKAAVAILKWHSSGTKLYFRGPPNFLFTPHQSSPPPPPPSLPTPTALSQPVVSCTYRESRHNMASGHFLQIRELGRNCRANMGVLGASIASLREVFHQNGGQLLPWRPSGAKETAVIWPRWP